MATLQDLENAIDALLEHPLGMSQFQLLQPVREKAYEAYVFGLCLRAVREVGANPILRGIDGPPNPFIFRGGPGRIYSRFRNYGYAFFTLNNEEFEIHAGVEYQGTSRMRHELDVSIIRAADAVKARRDRRDPKSKGLIGAWECKFYTSNLDKALGREFVGLVSDLGSTREAGLCSNTSNAQLKLYFKTKNRPYPNFELTPLNPSNENILVNQIKATLKKITAA